jgi:hypothetical protein
LNEVTKKQCKDCKELNELLKTFGQALHAIQDLYAHTTYVENFGKDAKTPGDVPIWRFWNADGVANVPSGVISGAYRWPWDNAPQPNHYSLNKDEPSSIEGQKRNSQGLTWFSLAENVATRSSTAAWNHVVLNLTPGQKKRLTECGKQ